MIRDKAYEEALVASVADQVEPLIDEDYTFDEIMAEAKRVSLQRAVELFNPRGQRLVKAAVLGRWAASGRPPPAEVPATVPAPSRPPARPRRPRLVPDAQAAMQKAVDGLRADQTQLTWTNTATRIAEDVGLDGLDESTLREWAKEDGLPPPADPIWKRRSG